MGLGAPEPEAIAEAVAPPKPVVASGWSTDLVDPAGLTRMHLVARSTFTDGASVFSGASAWAIEAKAFINLTEGLALTAVLPFGAILGRPGAPEELFLGNLGVGVTLGVPLTSGEAPRLKLGFGVDALLPTASASDEPSVGIARSTAAAIRAYEPQLFVPELLSFRLRGLTELRTDVLSAQVELGLVPGLTVNAEQDFVLLFSAAGRVSADLGVAEPFLELGCATQVSGDGRIKPPFLVTPGLRLHIADTFDPALFVSFNFVESSAVIFGLDLAAAIRPSKGPKRARSEGADDFLDDF